MVTHFTPRKQSDDGETVDAAASSASAQAVYLFPMSPCTSVSVNLDLTLGAPDESLLHQALHLQHVVDLLQVTRVEWEGGGAGARLCSL